jgi:hypothetical protein
MASGIPIGWIATTSNEPAHAFTLVKLTASRPGMNTSCQSMTHVLSPLFATPAGMENKTGMNRASTAAVCVRKQFSHSIQLHIAGGSSLGYHVFQTLEGLII